MLHEFLNENRKEILALAEEKTKNLAAGKLNSDLLKKGLPLFYDQLSKILENFEAEPSSAMLETAAIHGKEFLRLGYSGLCARL